MQFESKAKFSDIEGLPKCVLQALEHDFGYKRMSSAQATYMQSVVNGQDVLVRAGTGSGKTLGFLLPLVTTLLREGHAPVANSAAVEGSSQKRKNGPAAVIISPVRELAEQTMRQAKQIADRCSDDRVAISVQPLVGNIRSSKDDAAALARDAQAGRLVIVVATPGRLLDHIENTPGFREALASSGRVLVLDEVDRLIDPGFKPAVMRVAAVMKRPDRQTLLFTATATAAVREATRSIFARADDVFIDAGQDKSAGSAGAAHNANVTQEAVLVPAARMIDVLWAEFLKEHAGRTVIFVQTAAMASLLTQTLARRAAAGGGQYKGPVPKVIEIHSRLSQSQRSRAVKDFSNAKPPVAIVATDVFARGLDVQGVSLVLQLGIAPDNAQVAHRVGRTGRGGATGRGLMILEEREAAVLKDLVDREKMPIRVRDASEWPELATSDKKNAVVSGNSARGSSGKSDKDDARAYAGVCRAFTASIGFYKSHLSRLKWKVADLSRFVTSIFAPMGVSAASACPIKRSTLKKMGLSTDHGFAVLK